MENRTYLPVDGEIQTEENIGKYGESVAAYESVLAGEAWPDNFWAATNLNRRIKEILTYLLRDKLKINEYETAKGVLSAGFIEEYGLSKLVEKAGGNIVGMAAVLAEGDAQERDDIVYLDALPLFVKK